MITSWVKDTGFRSDFCSKCGAPVPNPLRGTDFVWIPAGALDADVDMPVVAHVYPGSAAAWDARPVARDCLEYDAAPNVEQFFAAIRLSHR